MALAKEEVARLKGFASFKALKKALRSPGEEKVWHYIVDQRKPNIKRFGARAIHNADKVVAITVAPNQKLNAFYSSKMPFTGRLTARQWMDTLSYAAQRRWGLIFLERARKGEL